MDRSVFLEKIKTYGTLIHDKHININNLVTDIKKFTNIEELDIILQFCSEFENIYFSRTETSSKDLLSIVINPSAAPIELKRFRGNSDVIRVAYIRNVSGNIKNIFMRQDGLFVDQDGTQIAENTDAFLQYLLTVEFDYHAPIMPQTLELLKDAGWFKGRKVDISDLLNKYKSEGIIFSDAQINFMQEFGGIKGKDLNGKEFEVCVDPKCSRFRKIKPLDSNEFNSYSPLNVVGNKENVDFLLAGSMGNNMVDFWTSTDGRLFADQGVQMGRTIMEELQIILLN